MVDWEYVDRARAAGRSWDEIAHDPEAGFRPDTSGIPAARQLRNTYRDRERGPAPDPPPDAPPGPPERRWGLARVGWILLPLFAPWAFLAYFLPSPFGVFLPVVPVLGILTAIAGVALAFGLLRTTRKWTPVFRTGAVVGFALGLLIVGSLGGVAYSEGCPVLSPFLTPEPGGWSKVPHASWTAGGAPLLFFYGSVACPFCSASSWAVLETLRTLGNVSGVTYDHSSSTDVDPNTPSVVLSDLSVASPYVALDARESTNDAQITAPGTGACIEQAYLSAYDPLGGIPFVVLGGTFVHTGTLVDPGALAGLTAAGVQGQLTNHTGAAYEAIGAAEDYLLAYLVWLNGDRPAAVAQESAVAAILSQIQ
jgi:hypothetical protein